MHFLNLYQILGFYNILWLFSWVLLFLASFRVWEKYNWIFGFFVFYIIFFPMYKRWDRYFNEITLTWSNLQVSVFILGLMLLFWIILFINILPIVLELLVRKNILSITLVESKIIQMFLNPMLNKNSKVKHYLDNFSLIWCSWVNLYTYIPFSIYSLRFLIDVFIKYLNTNKRKLWFFGLTIFLPRILTLVVLFYDVFIKNQLYWSPTVSLLLTISIIVRMSLTLVEKGTKICFTQVCDYLVFEVVQRDHFPSYLQEELNSFLDDDDFVFKLKLKDEFKDIIPEEDFEYLVRMHRYYSKSRKWSYDTKILLTMVFMPILLLCVTLNLIVQINIVLKIYHKNDS